VFIQYVFTQNGGLYVQVLICGGSAKSCLSEQGTLLL